MSLGSLPPQPQFSAVGGVGEAKGGREGSGTRDVGEDADIARWRQRRPEELVRRLLGGVGDRISGSGDRGGRHVEDLVFWARQRPVWCRDCISAEIGWG